MSAATAKGNAASTNAVDAIDVLEGLLAARYSCRAFKPDPVPRPVIERILRAAQRTASWCNSQPWHVTIMSGAETERFRKMMYETAASGADSAPDFPWPREYVGVYQARRRESGFQLYDAVGIAKGDKAAAAKQALENFNFFGAPHVAIITTTEPLGVYGAVDCGAYVANFMLAAQALGVGSIAQAALARRSDVVRDYLKFAEDRRVVCGISFGHPKHDHIINSYRTSRAPLSEAVTFVGE
ncbi:nitroreductase [Bradyrhizobium sp. LHD-71]|uniref:nitroreductase n=1 Tax=Bradyrhizobium sp. LHD-71 TaxID=3072141 RepID=UPI00280D00F3|nr:nitroreductase [Bradyrhizobium sp. LHD-71]MDQ8732274.1 nitroreductase [Bradyrhizobium sp. LHD-71]